MIIYGGRLHDKGNATAYKETGSLAWPVMVASGSFAPGPVYGNQTAAKLTCVRAMNGTTGSVTPGWSSAGGRRAVNMGVLGVVLALSVLAA